jgi:hypothetical protein
VTYRLHSSQYPLAYFGRHQYLSIGDLVNIRVTVKVFTDKAGRQVVQLEPADKPSNF